MKLYYLPVFVFLFLLIACKEQDNHPPNSLDVTNCRFSDHESNVLLLTTYFRNFSNQRLRLVLDETADATIEAKENNGETAILLTNDVNNQFFRKGERFRIPSDPPLPVNELKDYYKKFLMANELIKKTDKNGTYLEIEGNKEVQMNFVLTVPNYQLEEIRKNHFSRHKPLKAQLIIAGYSRERSGALKPTRLSSDSFLIHKTMTGVAMAGE